MAGKLAPTHRHHLLYLMLRHSVFLSQLIGILPVSVDQWDLNIVKPNVTFKFHKYGLIFTTMQIVILFYMTYVTAWYFSWIRIMSPLVIQVLVIMSCAILRSYTLHIYSFIRRTKDTIGCLNESSELLNTIKASTKSNALSTCIAAYCLLAFGSFPIILRWINGEKFFDVAPFVISNLQEIAIIIMMNILLKIVELSLEDINRTVEGLHEHYGEAQTTLQTLMIRHWKTCDLYTRLSECFGLDVVLQCWYNLTKIVLLSYYSYFMLITKYKYNCNHLVTATDVPYRFFVVWYIGRHCDRITKQMVESRRLLAELMIVGQDKMDLETKKVINIFLLQLRSRCIRFSACGLFELNRAKFYGMLQMSVTYVVLLAQFNSFM